MVFSWQRKASVKKINMQNGCRWDLLRPWYDWFKLRLFETILEQHFPQEARQLYCLSWLYIHIYTLNVAEVTACFLSSWKVYKVRVKLSVSLFLSLHFLPLGRLLLGCALRLLWDFLLLNPNLTSWGGSLTESMETKISGMFCFGYYFFISKCTNWLNCN